MWAVVGVWEIDASLIEQVRAQVPEMAQGKIGMPGFLHGTWTRDGHVMMVFADEQAARRAFATPTAPRGQQQAGARARLPHHGRRDVAPASPARLGP